VIICDTYDFCIAEIKKDEMTLKFYDYNFSSLGIRYAKTFHHENISFLYNCFNKWNIIDEILHGKLRLIPWGAPIHYLKVERITDCMLKLGIINNTMREYLYRYEDD
jgi:hypothetical protein